MSTCRETCGTLRGMLAHQAAGEDPCGWCVQAERTARLAAELTPRRPRPVSAGTFPPVTEAEASVNRAVLEAEVLAFERDHPEGSGREAGRNRKRGRRAA